MYSVHLQYIHYITCVALFIYYGILHNLHFQFMQILIKIFAWKIFFKQVVFTTILSSELLKYPQLSSDHEHLTTDPFLLTQQNSR